jgi:gliding motility-associated-like protein
LNDTTAYFVPLDFSQNINNTSVNANKYEWQIFSGEEEDLSLMVHDDNAVVPNYTAANMGWYLLKLQAINDKAPNCPTAAYSAKVFVRYESVLEVPNIFTPNGDLNNDEFKVKARELNSYHCIIYNRWGEKVFETSDPSESWNGKKLNNGGEMSAGVYYYVITGSGKKGQAYEFEGAVQLLREK